tara:strand:+ start:214 stop:402 length:189 start_codon:yes stop_codon:yes gene_type:complete
VARNVRDVLYVTWRQLDSVAQIVPISVAHIDLTSVLLARAYAVKVPHRRAACQRVHRRRCMH